MKGHINILISVFMYESVRLGTSMFHGGIIACLIQRLANPGTADNTQNDFDEVKSHKGEYGKSQCRPQGHFFSKAKVEISHEPDRAQSVAANEAKHGGRNLAEKMTLFCQTEAGYPGHNHKSQIIAAYRREKDTGTSLAHGKDRNAKKSQ